MTISAETPSRRAETADAVPSDQALKLLDVVDDLNTIRRLLRAAQMAASSDDADCGLATLIDTIEDKLTDARDKLDAARHPSKQELANV
jgi:hypothetical protein